MLPLVFKSGQWRVWAGVALMVAQCASGLTLNPDDNDSISSTAKTIVEGLLYYYNGDQPGGTPGQLPYPPYYWWESGGMWGALIDYWYATGDTTYNNMTVAGIQFQVGASKDFEPANQTFDLGNDDQCYWALTAMEAAEYNFQNPAADQPSWLSLAQAVFNRQVVRWDNTTCNGGLIWQVVLDDYKNSVTNGCFFNLAARLAKYTGNSTYLDWAVTTFEWELSVGLISPQNTWAVYDGTTPSQNCTSLDHLQWSYNVGMHLHGAAVVWNITQDQVWYDRTQGLLNGTELFFRPNNQSSQPYVMYEIECESLSKPQTCDPDQLSFKAWTSRFMALTARVAPFTFDFVNEHLRQSAVAAAASCTEPGSPGSPVNVTQCGETWWSGGYDGYTGAGQQLCAVEVVSGLLLLQKKAPVTATTGGTSVGNPNAGSGVDPITVTTLDITQGDRAGAWFLTAFMAILFLGGATWVVI